MDGRDLHNLTEAYHSICLNEAPLRDEPLWDSGPAKKPTPTTTTKPVPTTTATPAPTRPAQSAPQAPTPSLSDLRTASARATMAGPSREAQALMSDRTKNILGTQRLQAGAQAQDKVAQMSASMPTSSSTPRAAINPEWAKANPKLAAAEMERRRISGTSQTDNPLMKDMRSRMPLNSPSVQASNVSTLGKGFQSLTQNPNALKLSAPSTPTTQRTPTAPQKPTQTQSPTLSQQQQDLYKQAYQNRNNPLAKGRIQSELNKMTPEQRKLFQQYAQSQGQGNDWSNYKFESYQQKTFAQFMAISESRVEELRKRLEDLQARSEESDKAASKIKKKARKQFQDLSQRTDEFASGVNAYSRATKRG